MKQLMFVAGALTITSLIALPAPAQVTKGKSRPALTKQIMSGLVMPNGTAIGKATRNPPADDNGWKALATNAALLNELHFRRTFSIGCHLDGDGQEAF